MALKVIRGNRIPIFNPTPLLQQRLSESQLIILCEQGGPVIKHFAFKALSQLNFKSAKEIFKDQISDSTELYYECNCLGGAPVSINLDFLNTLKDKLTDLEKKSYLQSVKANCSPSIYEAGIKFFNF